MENTVSIGLLMIANSITDVSEIAMLRRWRKEYELLTARRSRPAKVLAAIGEGYDTLSEISFFTNIPAPSVHRILMKLVREKRLRSVRTKNQNKRREFRFEIV
jgi:hypothetical protein